MRVLSLVALVVGLLAIGATAASAQSYATPAPVITVTGVNGNTANVSGSGWQAGALITVTVASAPVTLGTVTASAAGTFSQNFDIPCSIGNGNHTVFASGIAADGVQRSALTTITISGCTVASTSGALAFTGSNSGPWAGIGAVALLLGAVLTVVGMRRRGARETLQA